MLLLFLSKMYKDINLHWLIDCSVITNTLQLDYMFLIPALSWTLGPQFYMKVYVGVKPPWELLFHWISPHRPLALGFLVVPGLFLAMWLVYYRCLRSIFLIILYEIWLKCSENCQVAIFSYQNADFSYNSDC